MLTLTENAATAIKSIVGRSAAAETGGLRIFESADPGESFALGIAGTPEPADSVVESDGARIFLDPDATVALDHQVLDAHIDDAGAVRFALDAQR